jgi:hypothetical protein
MSSFTQTWPWKLRNTAKKKQHQTHATHAQSSPDHMIYYFLAQAREHWLTFFFLLPACYFEVQQHHVLTKLGNTWFSKIVAPNVHMTFQFKDRTHTWNILCTLSNSRVWVIQDNISFQSWDLHRFSFQKCSNRAGHGHFIPACLDRPLVLYIGPSSLVNKGCEAREQILV